MYDNFRYMMFFQVPFVPEFSLGVNDGAFFNQMHKWLPNNKPSFDEIEAYKYTFSTRGSC